MTKRMRQNLIWCGFAAALVLATAPAWRVLAFGVARRWIRRSRSYVREDDSKAVICLPGAAVRVH